VKRVLRDLSFSILAAVVLALLLVNPVGAQGPQNISVVLIIDNSGSMGRTDPAGLRFVAASQLVDLLEEGDEISVTLFADDSTVLVPLTKVTDAASRDAIQAGLTPVAPADNTNMRAGLEAGLAELETGSASVRIGIFLTDGELHPPDWLDLSAEAQDAERAEVVALADGIGEKGWGLFPISLASAVEPEFLQQLADSGGGLYHEAPLAGDLTLVFQEIFAASKLDVFAVLFSDCLAPGEQSSLTFPVHEFVSTLSLFVTYTGDLRPTVTVAGPDGVSVSPTGGDDRYDAFTIDGPARGTWTATIAGAAEGESCVSISSTPRTLVEVEWLQPLPSVSLAPGEPLDVAVRLTARDPQSGDGLPVDDASVTVTVVGPGGQFYEGSLDPVAPGEYEGAVDVDGVEGLYSITLVAETEEGEVARRSLEVSVSPPPAAAPSPSPKPGVTPVPSPDGAEDGGGGFPLALMAIGPVLLAGLGASFAAYSHFGRPVLGGWLMSASPERAYGLESRHRRIWTRRALTIGGPGDDIDLGLAKRSARIIPRRGGECLLQAGSADDVAVDGRSLRRGQRQQLRHRSEIKVGGVTLEYREYVGGPRMGV
jgi:Mg-chelatase subunit ChlD